MRWASRQAADEFTHQHAFVGVKAAKALTGSTALLLFVFIQLPAHIVVEVCSKSSCRRSPSRVCPSDVFVGPTNIMQKGGAAFLKTHREGASRHSPEPPPFLPSSTDQKSSGFFVVVDVLTCWLSAAALLPGARYIFTGGGSMGRQGASGGVCPRQRLGAPLPRRQAPVRSEYSSSHRPRPSA